MVERRADAGATCWSASPRLGAVAALAPVIAACTGGGASAAPSGAASASPSAAAPSAAATADPARRRRSPSPRPSCSSTTGPTTSARRRSPTSRRSTGSRSPTTSSSNTDEAYAKLGDDGGGYDVSFPISVDIPAFIAKGALLELDKSLLPNIGNLGAGVGRTRATTRATRTRVPYMWWTTGVAYDTTKIDRRADQQQGALGPALREAHLDARRLAGGLRDWP